MKTILIIVATVLSFFPGIKKDIAPVQKETYTVILPGAIMSFPPCLNEMLEGDYVMTYTWRGNDWQLRIDALMYGQESGLEYNLETMTIVTSQMANNPSGRAHNTSVYNLKLRLGDELIGKIHGTVHTNFLNDRIVTEIDHLQSQCK
ncbi:MAG: hypothetical protein ACM3RX_01810 [Methanococcaceae archaeon]